MLQMRSFAKHSKF